MTENQNSHLPFFLFVIALFLAMTGPRLFADGMFLDGLVYASISRNMAEGLGQFWSPHYTYGVFPEFYEHPPLAFGLQSAWFFLFGDSILVERFYSLFAFMSAGLLITLIWKEMTGNINTSWIPLLFWMIIPVVTWACVNNMLENTMSVFTCLSAWFYFKSIKRSNPIFILLSGLALSLALLTKGVVCLYIWAFPFFDWLLLRRENFRQMILRSARLVLFSLLPVCLLYLLSTDARNYLSNYFAQQVVWNSQHVNTAGNRFAIIGSLLQAVLIPIILASLILLISYKRKISLHSPRKNFKLAAFFFLITLAGVFPIMISVKQSDFYILTVFPFFALGLSSLIYPLIIRLIDFNPKKGKLFTIIGFVCIGLSVAIILLRPNKPHRDESLVTDSKKIVRAIGYNQVLTICPQMYHNWNLHGYLARYGNISLVPDSIAGFAYYLSDSNCDSARVSGYYDTGVKLELFRLYIKQ